MVCCGLHSCFYSGLEWFTVVFKYCSGLQPTGVVSGLQGFLVVYSGLQWLAGVYSGLLDFTGHY